MSTDSESTEPTTEPRETPSAEHEPGAQRSHPRKRGWLVVLRDALIITVAASAVGLVANAIRTEEKIPWVQQQPYETLVPCPEPVGDPTEMQPDDPLLLDQRSLVIDARSKPEFGEWHVNGSMNLEFDWLGPPIDNEVKIVARQVAKSGAQRVVIYGDGDEPDSGREWARLLSGARIKNVFYVKGGGPALMKRMKEGSPP